MAGRPINEEEINQTVAMWHSYGRSRKATAEALGISLQQVQRRLDAARHLAQQGEYEPAKPVPEGLTLKGTSALYDADGNVRQLWNKTKVQGREVEDTVQLADPKKIIKVSTNYDAQGRVAQQWVQERPEDAEREKLWTRFAHELAEPLPQYEPTPPPSIEFSDDLMNFIPFGDPHFGMYSWAEETGQDFDLDIAKRDLCGAVDFLVSQAPLARRCVIANLGDFFHADNLEGVTPEHRNILDMDTRLPKVVRVGVAAMRQAIRTALQRHEVVEVVNARGNHDPMLSMALSIMLAHVYENEPRVIIHDQPTMRHYITHGKVLLGVTHGNRTKDRDLPGIMAAEQPQAWGASRHRRWYRGHHHQDAVSEFNGCTVEQVRTLAPGDAYAVGGGWLSGRDMKLIVFHAEHGEVSRTTCSIDLLRHVQSTMCVPHTKEQA